VDAIAKLTLRPIVREIVKRRPAREIIARLPEEQRCALSHWVDRHVYDAKRRDIRSIGDGAKAVTYSLRPFDEHRCIFVHIPKAAGISVNMALFGNLAGGHSDAPYYRRVFGRDFWRYFKFTFVRNPYTRLVSAYEFFRRGGHPAWASNQRFRDEILSEYVDFSDFVLRWLTPRDLWPEPHFRPQHEFLELGGRLVMDFVGRVERIEDDFTTVCGRLGIQAHLGRLNETRDGHAALGEYYSSDAVERRVRDFYARDFELFGYSARPPIQPS
jgi:chondroitin 4-sulfotransferase 11